WMKVLAVVAVLAAIVAVMSGGAGAAGAPSGATLGGAKAGPASTSALKSAPTRAVGRRPAAARSAASRAAARHGALLRHANFKTIAGVKAYLRAIGINPRGVVIQRGLRNYAGPNCPGAGWACTSAAHPVVQIAAAGGKNTFSCTTRSCAVVQTTRTGVATKTKSLALAAAPNTAKCNKTSGLMLTCSITQINPSGDNVAIVVERAKQASSNDAIQ